MLTLAAAVTLVGLPAANAGAEDHQPIATTAAKAGLNPDCTSRDERYFAALAKLV